MRVNGNGFPDAARIYHSQGLDSGGNRDIRAGRREEQDQIVLSPQVKLLQALQDKLAEVPDIREDKVSALAGRLADGTYQVSVEDIAEAIVGAMPDQRG